MDPPSAQMVGNAFVDQYYHILHHSPELVHRFYQDTSVLSRPDPSGVMISVTSMKDINDKICSLDYTNYKAEIKTADAQNSYKDGVIVLVTGCLTGKNNLRRKFAQTFFLAPQDNGYFVLNDVFRFAEENEPDPTLVTGNGTDDAPTLSLIPEPEPDQTHDPSNMEKATSHTEVGPNDEEKAPETVEDDMQVWTGREILVEVDPQLHENGDSAVADPATQGNAPKKSYASIVSSQSKKGPTRIYVPANSPRSASTKTDKQVVVSTAQASALEVSAPSVPSDDTVQENNDTQAEAEEGHSIYVRNLPLNVTVAELELEFKKFGPIKQGGVQVRSNKQQGGFCFGFVEFQDLSSMQSAIEASPVTIGGRQAVVEIKRTATRVGSSRGPFISVRGGFRNDGFRGRGNFNGGRGYGRFDFGGRSDFFGRGRIQGGRGESYQQVRGRGGRRGGSNQNDVST